MTDRELSDEAPLVPEVADPTRTTATDPAGTTIADLRSEIEDLRARLARLESGMEDGR